MSLFRIVYVSDAVGDAAVGLLPWIDIIGASDRNNRRDHLTGILMRHEGRFFQAVEGARVDLDRLMGRLRTDHRHANIQILSDGPIPQRLFPGFAMAQADAPPALKRMLAGSLTDPSVLAQADRILVDVSRAMAAVT
ncbi:BLUF domain-containing protein [Brevundimonas sp. SL130]|uniref:BLUF domain-containing protein n=1 Tax=Brevundimonas sp. SL130 TaxID=2995143 RepID=UPI00226C717D|nr:BLUF domain-containing protein [Brevundimonas sp. SL130]WAC60222.1 BLUF domain-containing protein [Brevundimonas sp. SL130]